MINKKTVNIECVIELCRVRINYCLLYMSTASRSLSHCYIVVVVTILSSDIL